MVEELCQQQPHQGLIEDFIELSEGLSESSDMCAVVFPREKKEEILPFVTEEGSGKEIVEEPQELVLNPFPTNNPLPVAPSTDQVYILPTPETPSPKATPFALPWLHNFRNLVAIAQTFATTSKTLAATYSCHGRVIRNQQNLFPIFLLLP